MFVQSNRNRSQQRVGRLSEQANFIYIALLAEGPRKVLHEVKIWVSAQRYGQTTSESQKDTE